MGYNFSFSRLSKISSIDFTGVNPSSRFLLSYSIKFPLFSSYSCNIFAKFGREIPKIETITSNRLIKGNEASFVLI